MTHKITAFLLKSIRKSYKSILKSYKNVTSADFGGGIEEE